METRDLTEPFLDTGNASDLDFQKSDVDKTCDDEVQLMDMDTVGNRVTLGDSNYATPVMNTIAAMDADYSDSVLHEIPATDVTENEAPVQSDFQASCDDDPYYLEDDSPPDEYYDDMWEEGKGEE